MSLAGMPELFRTHRIRGVSDLPTDFDTSVVFPDPIRNQDITFKTAIQFNNNTGNRSGLIFEIGGNIRGTVMWIQNQIIGFRAGRDAPSSGVHEEFDYGAQWPANLILNIVASVRPGMGGITVWVNGTEVIFGMSDTSMFELGMWSGPSDSSFASDANGDIRADVPVDHAPINFAVIEPLSVYVRQAPRHFRSS